LALKIPPKIKTIARGTWDFSKFTSKVIGGIKYAWRYRYDTLEQMHIMGNQALPLVLIAAMSIGMVLTLEWGKKLELFGAKLMLGRMVSISVIREIGPTITGLMLAGRSGAKLVSELGNMRLSEQIEALRAFGIDPVYRLIVPRVIASLLLMLPITIIADISGIIAGWFAAVMWMGIDSEFFWISVQSGLLTKDLLIGAIKPPFYGLFIGLVGCYFGYNVTGGTVGLGKAATLTVMLTSISVLLLDFILTKTILSFY
jgi:phospholipid/cholesterol/gamma-HCH transport system permease protein